MRGVTTPVDVRREDSEGLSRTADGAPVPPARERSRPLHRLEDPLMGWVASIGVMLLALFLRLWKLGTPNEFEFDETYYAKDAWSMLNNGYVLKYVEDADEQIIAGTVDGLWQDDPSMIVHPEGGKWMIALGQHLFGMDSFGWRISAAVVGSLMVLVMCRLVLRLTGSLLLGCLAGLLLTFDGMHLVLSRLALLDIFLSFWLLCAAAALVVDRDWTRARMTAATSFGAWGPLRGLWFRPWRLVAGLCFGMAISTKWSGLYLLAVFGLLVWAWDAGARRSVGVRMAWLRSATVDAAPAFVHLVVVAGLVYVASWGGWLAHADEYEEHLSSTQYTGFVGPKTEEQRLADGDEDTCSYVEEDKTWPTATEPDAQGPMKIVQSLRSLWYYHHDIYIFHRHYLNCSSHTYQSDPEGWLLLSRSVGVNVENDIPAGEQGCTASPDSHCIREVLLLGTPMIWWAGALALVYAGVVWVGRRDWRFGFALLGALAMWLPWELNDERPIFGFYASAILPFLVIALTLALGHVLGPDHASSRRRTLGTIVAGSFFVLVLLNFAWFWPIWTNGLLTESEWLDRMWFVRWI